MEVQKKWRAPAGGSSATDGGALEKAEALLKTDELDITEFTHFFARGFAAQVVQSWSYFAQVNDHSKFTSSTTTLTKLLKVASAQDDVTEYAVQMIKSILTGYSKTLYRALSSMRASTANPVLRLIDEIISFKNGALLDDFVALFDFSLPALPKLLVPTKSESTNVATTKEKEHLSMRYNLIRVLLSVIKFSSPLLRKDFLSNNTKIISNWFKYISTIDSDSIIERTLSVWDDKILKESSFKKSTKLKIFNEWNLSKLLPIYYTTNKDLKSNLNALILSVSTDSKYGLKFSHEETWFLQSSSKSSLEVNKKHYKTNNKVIYSVLSALKPWDDEMQLNTAVQILDSIPELIPPYTDYLASRGLHDPKLTAYWIGQTLLISKIIRLDVPEDIEQYTGLSTPSKSSIAKLIVPAVLNRSVLTKCLQSDSPLIRQLSSQLVMDSVLKLKHFVKLYDSKKWYEAKVDLISYVYHLLPELASVSACISDSYSKKPENKILLATLLMIMNSYVTLFSDNHNYAQTISKPYMDVINEKQYSSLDLVLLGSFLKLQGGDSSQLKWWNKSDKSNSLFTSLLKIASSNSASSMTNKVSDLLSNLLKQTVIFNYDNLKVDPATVLTHSLEVVVGDLDLGNADISKIWSLLDESISRCVRSPFKYLDASNDNGRLSPFIITLFEQWKFVDKTTDYHLTSKWFVFLLRFLIIAGEPCEPVMSLISEIELDFNYSEYLFQNQLEDSIPQLSKDDTLSADCSFFGIVTGSSLDRVQKESGIPVTDLDIVGGLLRLDSAVQSDKVSLQKLQKVLSEVLTKIGNYLFTHPESTKTFSAKKYWSNLFLAKRSEKSTYLSGVLVEIFSQLDNFNKSDFSETVKALLPADLDESQQVVLGDSIWALPNEDLRAIVLSNPSLILKKSALENMIQRGMTISSNELCSLMGYSTLKSVLSSFVSQDLVVYGDLLELFQAISKDQNTWSLIHALVQRSGVVEPLINFVGQSENANLMTYLASTLDLSRLDISSDSLSLISSTATSLATTLIEEEEFSFMSFDELSRIFTNSSIEAAEDHKSIVLTYALERSFNKFAPELPSLINSLANFEDSNIRTWLNKSVLYLTKIFSELPEPPSHFFEFLANFKTLLLNVDVPKVFNKSNINALLEVIFTKWVSHETALELASIVALTCSRSFLEFGKLLQIIVNNDNNVLIKTAGATSKSKYLSALITYRLYEFDPSKNSTTSLQEKILCFYCGSTRAEDLLLFRVLEKLESKLNASWIDDVYSWDFLDDLNENDEELIGETRLIEKKREGFVVVLNKKYIYNGLNNYGVTRHILDISNSGTADNWKNSQEFFDKVSRSTPSDVSQTSYDPLFLSLLIINNDELVSVSAAEEGSDLVVKSNMKKLVESELLTAVVINLASEDQALLAVTKKIIESLLNSLKVDNVAFKEKHLFEIFFKKLLFTFEKEEITSQTIPPLIFIMVSRFVTILNNPGHMLYEKAFRWVLKSPFVRTNEIPLFQEITTVSSTSEENDLFYKQVSWLIESLTLAVKTDADVILLRKKNVFEWIFNLLNSPYVDSRLRYQVYGFVAAVQDANGGDCLTTRYAGLANIEQTLSKLLASGGMSLQQEQEQLNLKELALKYSIIGNNKRLADWASGDIENFTKRMMA